MNSYRQYPEWFLKWQRDFYNSSKWRKLRNQVRTDKRMHSDMSGKLIKGKSIVDHIIPITPDNYMDDDITLNPDNLQLLSIEEHNVKTFGKKEKMIFEPNDERKINLF
ncbi:HNH endonuclease [Weissella diestrammenae]|nr:HNH endonuclease [Weissella diestrammenae]